jgi:hypothetical protein
MKRIRPAIYAHFDASMHIRHPGGTVEAPGLRILNHGRFQPSLRDLCCWLPVLGVETPGYSRCVPLGRGEIEVGSCTLDSNPGGIGGSQRERVCGLRIIQRKSALATRAAAIVRALVLLAAWALCLQTDVRPAHAQPSATESDFPFVIQPEIGSSEFAPGDGITITSLRGDREHIAPGGRYLLEGSYTLASADSADLGWFSTSRGPSGSAPVAPEQHVKIAKGSGNFRLIKAVSDDGWLHVSFYANGHSSGGVYFGEYGREDTILRKKAWSDSSKKSAAGGAGLESPVREQANLSDPANAAIMTYLGNPVAAPANLDAKYTPTNLLSAFTAMSNGQRWQIQKLAVDDSEFPFLVYGLIAGRHELNAQDIRKMQGYDYGGSVRGSTGSGATHFSLNMIPFDQFPDGQSTACHRRLMVRLQMLADRAERSE